MSYLPEINHTTTPASTGWRVDGSLVWSVAITKTGALATGTSTIATAVVPSVTRVIQGHGSYEEDNTPAQYPAMHTTAAAASTRYAQPVFIASGANRNIRVALGPGWTSTFALSDALILMEYLP